MQRSLHCLPTLGGECRLTSYIKLACLFAVAIGYPTVPVTSLEVDSAVDRDTRFEPRPRVNRFRPELKSLWTEALQRPEAEMQRQAAMAITRAHQMGMPNLEDTATLLTSLLRKKSVHQAVELAAIQALIQLDARQAAPLLMERAASEGIEVTGIVEPALARWDYQPMRERWHRRIQQNDTSPTLLVLAIESLAIVNDVTVGPQLKQLALDEHLPPDIRIKAARAAGQLQREDLEEEAGALLAADSSQSLINRLVAALLIRHHSGPAAEELLLTLAIDPEGAVGLLALERLREIDPMLVADVNDQLVASPDANIRRLAAECLFRQATPRSSALLGTLLNDPIPDIRATAGEYLTRLDGDARLRDAVRSAAMEMLGSQQRRGLEQAALVVGTIDHEPASKRLIQLLGHSEPDVSITAAWALRKLAVSETAASILEKVRHEMEETAKLDAELWKTWFEEPKLTVDFEALDVIYRRAEHLLQALGTLRFREAESLLRQYLPAPKVRALGDPPNVAAAEQNRLRAAAIWALSHIHAGEPDPELTKLLMVRLNNTGSSQEPDPPEVRAAAAAALARMKATDAIDSLREYRGERAAHDMVGATCGRALHELAGDPLPVPVPNEVYQVGWFLEPVGTE